MDSFTLTDLDVDVHVTTDESERKTKLINAADFANDGPKSWESFVGQDRVKQQLQVHISSAIRRGVALDHVLLASGMPGVGKTTLGRIIAKELHSEMIQLVPPFHKNTLFEAASSLGSFGVLFIDEIHKMADGGKAMAENLLHILEERRIYADGGAIELKEITVIGATTDPGKLPEPLLDRFPIKPHFEPYDVWDLSLITAQFVGRYGADASDDVILAIASACRKTPRVARELVMAARDLGVAYGRPCTPEELFDFKQMDPDGMTLQHRNYLIALFRNFARKSKSDGSIEYIAGEDSMVKLLRETKGGLASIERFLIELGLLDQGPRGRRLTEEGVQRAAHYAAREGHT